MRNPGSAKLRKDVGPRVAPWAIFRISARLRGAWPYRADLRGPRCHQHDDGPPQLRDSRNTLAEGRSSGQISEIQQNSGASAATSCFLPVFQRHLGNRATKPLNYVGPRKVPWANFRNSTKEPDAPAFSRVIKKTTQRDISTVTEFRNCRASKFRWPKEGSLGHFSKTD